MVGLVATASVRTTRTVVPGCSFADLFVRLAILPSLDRLAEKWPAVFVAAVVDDETEAFQKGFGEGGAKSRS